MTATSGAEVSTAAPARAGPRAHLTGTVRVLRFLVRRDRIRLPVWVVGVSVFVLYVVIAVPQAYGDEDLAGATSLLGDPIGRLLVGPGYGFDDPTLERFVVNGYGLYLLLTVAVLGIMTVVRHTRVEEQLGRADLVRAQVVGRHAPLVAALSMHVMTQLAAATATFLVLTGVGGFGPAGAAVFAASMLVTGLAYGAVAAVTSQVASESRSAVGLAAGFLGLTFVLRAVGDMAAIGGSWWSWWSPLGWAQQTAPYALDRWWPLAFGLALALTASVAALVVSSRRDLGSGTMTVRPGRATAPVGSTTVWGFARRLHRASVAWWTGALAVSGALFGAFSDSLLASFDELPDVFDELFGAGDVLDGYLAYMAVFMAFATAAYVVTVMQWCGREEGSGRLESVLSASVGRVRWLTSVLVVAVTGVVVMMSVTGLTTGTAAALATGEWRLVGDLVLAHVNQVPAVLVVLGAAVALYGWVPRAVGAVWALVVFAVVVGTFGPLLDLPSWVFALSPFDHPATVPTESFSAMPLVGLVAVAAALAAVGSVGFARRDLEPG